MIEKTMATEATAYRALKIASLKSQEAERDSIDQNSGVRGCKYITNLYSVLFAIIATSCLYFTTQGAIVNMAINGLIVIFIAMSLGMSIKDLREEKAKAKEKEILRNVYELYNEAVKKAFNDYFETMDQGPDSEAYREFEIALLEASKELKFQLNAVIVDKRSLFWATFEVDNLNTNKSTSMTK